MNPRGENVQYYVNVPVFRDFMSEEAGCHPALQVSMNLEELRLYLLAKKGATEETPFGPGALVYKVMGKMFALVAEMTVEIRDLNAGEDVKIHVRELRLTSE